MSGPGVGYEYEPVPVSYYKRDLLLFANSIGCTAEELHFLFEFHPNFQAFPTYSIILPFKTTSAEVIDFYAAQSGKRAAIPNVPSLDSRRVVHGEQSITFLKPLPTSSEGKALEIRAKVVGVYDKGKPGTVVETEHLLVDRNTGEAYSRAVGSAFFVGQGGWGGPKGPKTVNYPPPEGRKPDFEYVVQTTPETALLYRLNGDYNPLHATPEPGIQMGFGSTIIHGLWSWNSSCYALLKLLGDSNPDNIKEFAARFASPVKPGDTLVTQIWRTGNVDDEGWEDIRFVTSIKGGKVCLSNGRAKMRRSGGKSKI